MEERVNQLLVVVVVVMVRGQNPDRIALPWKRHDRAAVGLLEDAAGKRLGRTAECDLAAVQAENLVPPKRLVEVVRRDQDSPPLAGKVGEQCLEQLGTRRVDPGERLVEQQHRRVLDERSRDEDALALAARQLPELHVGFVGEPDARKRSWANSRSRRPANRHHGRREIVPISATSSALTG